MVASRRRSGWSRSRSQARSVPNKVRSVGMKPMNKMKMQSCNLKKNSTATCTINAGTESKVTSEVPGNCQCQMRKEKQCGGLLMVSQPRQPSARTVINSTAKRSTPVSREPPLLAQSAVDGCVEERERPFRT